MGQEEIIELIKIRIIEEHKKHSNIDWEEIAARKIYHSLQIDELDIPRISHFIDENGNNVNTCCNGVNVILKTDGTHEYFLSYGFAGKMKLTPQYVVTVKKLNISDTISGLSNLKRYECDIEIDDEESSGFLTIKMSKGGKFVKWEDIQTLLNG